MDSLVCVVRVPNLSHNSLFKDRYDQQGVGGRGRRRGYWYSGFQVTGMIKWGQKYKEKNPWTKI